jgi:4-hydroxy-2-oxoheptanedioate aldolase
VTDYSRKAKAETLVVVLIEEREAVHHLPDILTVDHIEVFFVAPSDLAQTMGYAGQPHHPEVLAVVDRCLAQMVAAGKVPGHLGNEETVERYMEKGVRFFLTSWQPGVARGASQYLSKVVAKGG